MKMTAKNKSLIVIILLLSAVVLSFSTPIKKYEGTDFISRLKVPVEFQGWRGRDVSSALNLDFTLDAAKFINRAAAYEYIGKDDERLLFIILDAGNFHNPKVCFTSAGYEIKDLGDTELHIMDRIFKAHTLYTKRGGDNSLSLYWIVIDKKITHEWLNQKLKQLYFSMFNKERVGLMIRIDIPSKEADIKANIALAGQFFNDLIRSFPKEQAEYIFGEK